MEKFEENLKPEEKELSLDDLRSQIVEIKKEEMEKKKKWEEGGKKPGDNRKAYDAHFDAIEPEYLTDEDLEIYRKFKKENLSKEEFLNYKENMKNKLKEDYETLGSKSRHDFQAWLSNKILVREIIKKYGERRLGELRIKNRAD